MWQDHVWILIMLQKLWNYLTFLVILPYASICQTFPKCWRHYGECLDNNEPPLNTTFKVKPLNNENVIESFPNINNIDECSRFWVLSLHRIAKKGFISVNVKSFLPANTLQCTSQTQTRTVISLDSTSETAANVSLVSVFFTRHAVFSTAVVAWYFDRISVKV